MTRVQVPLEALRLLFGPSTRIYTRDLAMATRSIATDNRRL